METETATSLRIEEESKVDAVRREYKERLKRLQDACSHQEVEREWSLYDGKRTHHSMIVCLRCGRLLWGSGWGNPDVLKKLRPRIKKESEYTPVD